MIKMAEKMENGTVVGKVINPLLKTSLGAVVVIFAIMNIYQYRTNAQAADGARKDIIQCYEKRAETTQKMIQKSDAKQAKFIDVIQSLQRSMDALASKIDMLAVKVDP